VRPLLSPTKKPYTWRTRLAPGDIGMQWLSDYSAIVHHSQLIGCSTTLPPRLHPATEDDQGRQPRNSSSPYKPGRLTRRRPRPDTYSLCDAVISSITFTHIHHRFSKSQHSRLITHTVHQTRRCRCSRRMVREVALPPPPQWPRESWLRGHHRISSVYRRRQADSRH